MNSLVSSRSAAGGALYLGLAQALKIALTLLSTIIVARILAPGDYGVIAMAGPVTAFILLFQNIGLNQAVVQVRSITGHQLGALFWVNMLTSIGAAAAMLLLSPVAAWFYSDPRAGYVVAASAVTVLISGTALQHGALLNREMRFRALGGIEGGAATVNFVVTIAAALLLRSYWALWLGNLAAVLASTLLLWRFEHWRPGRRFTVAGTGAMLRFGLGLTTFNVLNFLSRNLDNVLIARMWGAAPLGLYDRAYKLMMFPLDNINGPLSRVMLPILARLNDEPKRFRRAFLTAARAIQLLTVPGVAVAVATSDRLIPFLLGPQWAEASAIFFWLALTALLQPLGNVTGWLFISSGRTGAMAQWGLFSSVTTVIGFAIGVQWGPVGVAISYFVGTVLRAPLLYAWSSRGTPVQTADLYCNLVPSLLGAAATVGSVFLLQSHMSFTILLCTTIPLSYALAVLVQATTPGGRDTFRTMLSQVPAPIWRIIR